MTIKLRKLGKQGPQLSVLGLGTWSMGGPGGGGWGPSDDRESIRTIHRAIDLGINWIDTAPVYGLGHAEELVGKAIQGRRDQLYIATKCGLPWNETGAVRHDISPASIRKEIENSLRRLDVDVIDLYQIHWPSANQSEAQAWCELLRLKREGKVRWIGVSNFDVGLMKQCVKYGPIDSLQPPYNLLQREIEKKILPFCRAQGIGVLSYSPMCSGLLSGHFDRRNISPHDWRATHPMFNNQKLEHHLAVVRHLEPIAGKYDLSVGQLAVAWVLRRPEITGTIIGPRSLAQIKDIVKIHDFNLTPFDIQAIHTILADPII